MCVTIKISYYNKLQTDDEDEDHPYYWTGETTKTPPEGTCS